MPSRFIYFVCKWHLYLDKNKKVMSQNFNTQLLFSIGHSRKLHTNNGTQYMYHRNEPYFTPSLCPWNLNDEFRAIKVCIIKYLYKFVNNSCLSDASQFSEKIYFNLLRPKLKSTYQNKHELCTSCCSSRCSAACCRNEFWCTRKMH